LQFAARMCAYILQHDNFLSRIVFTDEAKFDISGRVNRHNCAIWVSEPPREQLEHVRDSPKVNVRCALTYERVICPFFSDEDIITSSSFLDVLGNYALPQINNNSSSLIVQLDGASVHFAHPVRDC
jgi:hypothetical protein